MPHPQTLCPGILLKLLSPIEGGGRGSKRAALDINSGKKWKGERSCKTKEVQYQFYAWASSWHRAANTWAHYLRPITHASLYTKFYKHISYAYRHTNIHRLSLSLSPLSSSDSLALSDTHTLRGSMVGSDTKLMPCHTGCQQISQWITPQPLDVHRAKGHEHGRQRGGEERRGEERREQDRGWDWQW